METWRGGVGEVYSKTWMEVMLCMAGAEGSLGDRVEGEDDGRARGIGCVLMDSGGAIGLGQGGTSASPAPVDNGFPVLHHASFSHVAPNSEEILCMYGSNMTRQNIVSFICIAYIRLELEAEAFIERWHRAGASQFSCYWKLSSCACFYFCRCWLSCTHILNLASSCFVLLDRSFIHWSSSIVPFFCFVIF